MTEKPILFSGPMVRQILAGSKTQTRRPVKRENDPSPGLEWAECLCREIDPADTPCVVCDARFGPCPYAADRLWVREAWRAPISLDSKSPRQIGEMAIEAGYPREWCPVQYEACRTRINWDPHPSMWPQEPGRYRHARFMPRWASRIVRDVLSIRVERLHDISDADIIAEGVTVDIVEEMTGVRVPHLRDAWRLGWKHIYGAESWNANPWLWVIEFRRAEASR